MKIILTLGLLFSALAAFAAETNRPSADAVASTNAPPAKLDISGYGLFGNLKLKGMLRVLQEGKSRPQYFTASYIEDVALLLISRLRNDGYLEPQITSRLTLSNGQTVVFSWDESIPEPLPRPLRVTKARFRIAKGELFYFDALEFSGLEAMPEKTARTYFVESGGLLSLKQNRIYSPDRFDRSLTNLRNALRRMGYQNATVTVGHLERDVRTGAVRVTVAVREGPKFIVRSVRQEVYFENTNQPVNLRTNLLTTPYSEWWEQDYVQSIRTNYYHLGYPDTSVELETARRTNATNEVHLEMEARVRTGPFVRVGDVTFTGNAHTKERVLEQRVPLDEGDLLDRIRAERGRFRLSRLGVFDSVELSYTNVDEHTRDLMYRLNEAKRLDVSLLAGWGSYEMLRGRVQINHNNAFGLAHHQRFRLTQSFKSSAADYTYTMPQFFGENVDVFADLSGLRREEVSFTRLEYGGSAGARKYFQDAATDVSVRYSYQVLRAQDAAAGIAPEGLRNSTAAAIIADIHHDRRDNPLYPHRGHKFFSNIELASEYLGGSVNFQRLDLALAGHLPLSDAQWVHLGVSHGLVATIGSASEDLPFNRRFFPGGDNSIRGYQQGEAAPRNAEGKIVGAETYLLGNLEFEQGLTPKWSLVFFADAIGFARRLSDYPMDETLISVGGGIRWKTLIGPVRAEYGHNLNPRSRDPAGTFHFSLGFPF